MSSRLSTTSTTSSVGDNTPHPLDVFADGEGIKFEFAAQPPRLPMRPAPLFELHDVHLAHPVVLVKTARNRVVPVRGRGGEMDGVKLDEIFTILRLDELRADMASTGSRALEVTAEMEAMVASGRRRDDPLVVAKGFLVLTILQKCLRLLRLRDTLEQHLAFLRQQSAERVRRLCPGAASWPPGDTVPR